ncbi:MAG TPA: flagellar export chaperone FliS [Sphingomonas sp.]|jgi:flagellar protein FliS|uniref:flagellar export chaperone FliS n=1 Tax=Sphingomonas sp. TaxID=28214 RepID=UPI002EDA0FC1
MYAPARKPGNIGQQYRNIDLTSKIEGASPHRLIGILYEELILSMATLKTALRRNELLRVNECAARAQSIVQALEVSLDFKGGGEIARALALVYRESDRLIAQSCRQRALEPLESAITMIDEIAEAWNRIGNTNSEAA